MPKKTHVKATRALPAPVTVERRENAKSPNFVSMYANDVQVQMTPWDMRLILGEVVSLPTTADPFVRITQIGDLRISPQLAKRLTIIMMDQLKAYEERFGEIPSPPKD